MIVSKWGNSLAVRLPKELVTALDLKEGDQIELRYHEKERMFNVYRHLSPTLALRQLRERSLGAAKKDEVGPVDA